MQKIFLGALLFVAVAMGIAAHSPDQEVCRLCNKVVRAAQGRLRSSTSPTINSTEQDIEAALRQACLRKARGTSPKICGAVEAFTEGIFESLKAGQHPSAVCGRVGLCSDEDTSEPKRSPRQSCSCTLCDNTASVPAGESYTLYSVSCNTGETAVVTELNVATTDGSGFDLCTSATVPSTTCYTDAMATSVTCFDMGTFNVGDTTTIAVAVTCNNLIESCPFEWTLSTECLLLTTYSWTTGLWSACSSSCTATRDVWCQDNNGNIVANSNCDASTEPASTEACSGGSCPSPNETTSTDVTPNPARSSGVCYCNCCPGNFCTPHFVGNWDDPSCQTCSTDLCRSKFPSECPAAGSSGFTQSLCTSSAVLPAATRGIPLLLLLSLPFFF